MRHFRPFAIWACSLALEFALIFAAVQALDTLNPRVTESIARLIGDSRSVFATLVLGAIAIRTLAISARNSIGLRDAGARAALQAWTRSRRP
jgi:hypothetical protein